LLAYLTFNIILTTVSGPQLSQRLSRNLPRGQGRIELGPIGSRAADLLAEDDSASGGSVAKSAFCYVWQGSVQKLVGSRGDCDSCIWTADEFEPLAEAETKRPVVNCAADLQHQVGASPRPAHLLRLVHPAIDQEIRRALRRRSPDARAGAVSSGIVGQPGALATEILVDVVKRMPQFSGCHTSCSMTVLALVEVHDINDCQAMPRN
jgi:hypothetical protein